MDQGISQKTLLSIAGIVVFLLVIASFPWWSGLIENGFSSSVTHSLEFISFNTDKVEQFEIIGQGEQKTFQKEGENWKVNGTSVLQTAVNAFFSSMEETAIQSLASKNPENFKKLAVTEDTGYLLTISYNGKVYEYIVGTTGSQYNTFYIRKKTEDEAFLAQGTFRMNVVQPLASWTGEGNEE